MKRSLFFILLCTFNTLLFAQQYSPQYYTEYERGSDLAFIKYYCTEAIDFIEKNQLNNPKSANANMACNVFFEQIFLAILAEKSILQTYGKKNQRERGHCFFFLPNFVDKENKVSHYDRGTD